MRRRGCQRLLDLHATLFILALLRWFPMPVNSPGAEVAQGSCHPLLHQSRGAAGAAGAPS